jgi:hypothetical protein
MGEYKGNHAFVVAPWSGFDILFWVDWLTQGSGFVLPYAAGQSESVVVLTGSTECAVGSRGTDFRTESEVACVCAAALQAKVAGYAAGKLWKRT